MEMKLNIKAVIKRIDYQLKSHFFSHSEFNKLSKRKAHKALKYVAKISGVKLSRQERNDLIEFLKKPKKKVTKVEFVTKLWGFVDDFISTVQTVVSFTLNFLIRIVKCFRFNKYELMLN